MQFCCVIGKINIFGHIGDSFVDEAGILHKGTNLLNVIEQVESFPQATQFEVSINSPGGYVDVGDSIYDYLLSLKKQGKQLTTIQVGLIGSIATKLFLAGDRRIADDRYKFWIHNPFQENVSGDADALMTAANAVAETEKSLRKFYAEFTSITDEGLDALMKNETGLTADQCIKFKFATEKKLTPAFNAIKTTIKKVMANTKQQDEKSFMEHVKAFFNTEKPKGQQPKKAEIPGGGEKQNLVVTLAEGAGSFWVEGEALAEGSPAFLLDEAGQPTTEPLADGDYALEDGTKVTVEGGLVTAVMSGEEEEEQPEALTAEQVSEMIAAALAKAQEGSLAEVAKIKEEHKKEILALKSTLKLGVQPTKAVLNNGAQKLEYKSIAQRMAEKAEERKKQINKN